PTRTVRPGTAPPSSDPTADGPQARNPTRVPVDAQGCTTPTRYRAVTTQHAGTTTPRRPCAAARQHVAQPSDAVPDPDTSSDRGCRRPGCQGNLSELQRCGS